MFHVVDDEKDLREFLQEFIESLGYDVRAFDGPDSYLEYVKSPDFQAPFALISDVQMPGMNGYQMVEEMRRYYPDIPVAIVSGYSKCENMDQSSACVFLSKPVSFSKLEEAIATFVRCHDHGPDPEHCVFIVGNSSRICPLAEKHVS